MRGPFNTIFELFVYFIAAFCVVVTFVFSTVTLFGSSKYATPLHAIWWIKFENSGSQALTDSTHDNQQFDYYTFGILGACGHKRDAGHIDTDNYECFDDLKKPFELTWSDIIEWNGEDDITKPAYATEYEDTVTTSQKAAYILYIIGVGLTGLSIILGFLGLCASFFASFAALSSVVATLSLITASGLLTGVYIKYKKHFENSNQPFTDVSTGTLAMVLSWIAVGASVFATAFLGLLASRRRHDKMSSRY